MRRSCRGGSTSAGDSRSNPKPKGYRVSGKAFLDSIKTEQFPGAISSDGKQQTVTYSERLAIGYRWYDSNASGNCAEKAGRNPCVAFPFGHGLSYSSFTFGKPKLAFDATTGRWTASARVSNKGKRSGAEVVQVYLQLPESANAIGAKQPPRRLVGFQRIELAAGASGDVAIAIDPKASDHPLSVWDEGQRKWVVPQGTYTVWLGRSSSPRDLVRAGNFTQ